MPTANLARANPEHEDSGHWFHFGVVDESRYHDELAAKRAHRPFEVLSPLAQLTEPLVVAYRHDDVSTILTDENLFSTDVLKERYRPVFGRRTMLALTWHERRAFRLAVSSVLGPRNVDALRTDVLEPVIGSVVRELREHAEVDLVDQLARVIAPRVIARLFGMPIEAGPWLLARSLEMARYVEDPRGAMRAARKLRKRLRQVIEERRANLGSDLVSAMLGAESEDDPFDDDDVIDVLVLLTFAGTETAIPGMGSLFAALLAHEDQLEALRLGRASSRAAVDEALRWESPVQVTFRTAARDMTLGGIAVREGTTVMAHLGSANRDLPGLVNPDAFDINRPGPLHHLAFGTGPHRCIGMHLARHQLALALDHVLDSVPKLHLAPGSDVNISGQLVRGPLSLRAVTS